MDKKGKINIIESRAYVLDYLPHGKGRGKPIPIFQAVGLDYLNLIEGIKPKELDIEVLKEIPVLTRVKFIKYDWLTETSKINLEQFLNKFIDENEQLFVDFINKAMPITPKLHTLELLPNIGKKITWKIIEEREIEPFKSFQDIKDRLKTNVDLKKAIIKRFIEEYDRKDKYNLFVGQNSLLSKLKRNL